MRQPPTREPILPELVDPEGAVSFNTRVVTLRTSLGRAAIGLELRGATKVLDNSACTDEHRLQAGCSRCVLAGDGDAFDPELLDALVATFDGYPAAVLEATHIERVALCRSLTYVDDKPRDRTTIGTVDLRARRLLISIAPFLDRTYEPTGSITVSEIVHHELFHQFEYERMREAFENDLEWRIHNPIGFEYRAGSENEPRRPGFINAYASSSDLEDRASTYQYLLARSDELCALGASDATLRAKTRLLWRRVSSLVGPAFLRERAPCVTSWIDEADPPAQ